MHARVVLGVGKGVLFRDVSSVQECPQRYTLLQATPTKSHAHLDDLKLHPLVSLDTEETATDH